MSEFKDFTLIDGKPVRFQVRRSDRARRLSLHVTHREGLVVVIPKRMPLREVDQAIRANAAWIDQQVDLFGVRHGPQRREYVNGGHLLYLGQVRRLELRPLEANRKRSRLWLDEEVLHGRFAPEDLLDPMPVLERWLRRRAREVLEETVRRLAPEVGVAAHKIIIGERTSRWGSCSRGGNLSFCYRLVMAPQDVIDAVVYHELCHRRHLNHGKQFQEMLQRVCPEHKQRMTWLKDHMAELQF